MESTQRENLPMRNVVLMHELDTLSGVSDTIGVQGQRMRFHTSHICSKKGDKLSVTLKNGACKMGVKEREP
jgi:hypothetical protein